MKTRREKRQYKLAHRLRIQEGQARQLYKIAHQEKVIEVAPSLKPKWATRLDKHTEAAIKRVHTEEEEMKNQAAWVARCVKTHFEPFQSVEDIYISDGRVWYRDAAPAYLEFGLSDLIAYAISEFRSHGLCSEQHQIARATLGLLFQKDGKRAEVHQASSGCTQ